MFLFITTIISITATCKAGIFQNFFLTRDSYTDANPKRGNNKKNTMIKNTLNFSFIL